MTEEFFYRGELSELALAFLDPKVVEFDGLPGKWIVTEFRSSVRDSIRPLFIEGAKVGDCYIELLGQYRGPRGGIVEAEAMYYGAGETNPVRFILTNGPTLNVDIYP